MWGFYTASRSALIGLAGFYALTKYFGWHPNAAFRSGQLGWNVTGTLLSPPLQTPQRRS